MRLEAIRSTYLTEIYLVEVSRISIIKKFASSTRVLFLVIIVKELYLLKVFTIVTNFEVSKTCALLAQPYTWPTPLGYLLNLKLSFKFTTL